jgi:hypothetical protein
MRYLWVFLCLVQIWWAQHRDGSHETFVRDQPIQTSQFESKSTVNVKGPMMLDLK